MEFDLSGILPPEPGAAPVAPDMDRLISAMMTMQESNNALVEILIELKSRMVVLELDVRRLKARTDAPARSSILRVN